MAITVRYSRRNMHRYLCKVYMATQHPRYFQYVRAIQSTEFGKYILNFVSNYTTQKWACQSIERCSSVLSLFNERDSKYLQARSK